MNFEYSDRSLELASKLREKAQQTVAERAKARKQELREKFWAAHESVLKSKLTKPYEGGLAIILYDDAERILDELFDSIIREDKKYG